MASNDESKDEEDLIALQEGFLGGFNEAFGDTSDRMRATIYRIKNNDVDTDNLVVDWQDARFSFPAMELLGRYIANNTHLRKLSLSNNDLTDKCMVFLFQGLVRSSSLKELDLSGNDLYDSHGIRFMVPFLENSNLLAIDLSRNRDFNTNCFELLIRAIHGSLIKKLSLHECSIDDVSALGNCSLPYLTSLDLGNNILKGLSALENYTKLKTLCLSESRIGIDGCRTLAHLLQNEDLSLHTLDLDDNVIDDESAEIIANSLKHNTKLHTLHLKRNNIKKKGFKAFLKLLVNVSPTENTYKNSNHTLTCLSLRNDYVYDEEGNYVEGNDYVEEYILKIDHMLNINTNDNPGRRKVIDCMLRSDNRMELAELQGITCPSHNSVYSQIDPIVLPEVLALVCTNNDMYCALVATASDLTSLVNKPVVIKEKIEKKNEQIAHLNIEYNQKIGALVAEINQLNQDLQSLNIPEVSNAVNKVSENTTNADKDSGRKKRRRLFSNLFPWG